MKEKLGLVFILLAFGICTGCKVVTFDRMPAGAPKGYAEFYSVGIHGVGLMTWGVCEQIDGQDKKVSGEIWSGSQRRRIATSPGVHTFTVKLNPEYARTTIKVPENMIVPVRVYIEPECNKDGIYYSDYFGRFTMRLEPEQPVPFLK